jgi:flagellar basal body-associated protein FliL
MKDENMDNDINRKEGVISTIRELLAGVNRESIWIIIIGLLGIIFCAVFAATMLLLNLLRPGGIFTRGPNEAAVLQIAEVSTWLFGICSVVSVIAGVKVLIFIRSWRKSYSNLKAAEKALEKKYFNHTRNL